MGFRRGVEMFIHHLVQLELDDVNIGTKMVEIDTKYIINKICLLIALFSFHYRSSFRADSRHFDS